MSRHGLSVGANSPGLLLRRPIAVGAIVESSGQRWTGPGIHGGGFRFARPACCRCTGSRLPAGRCAQHFFRSTSQVTSFSSRASAGSFFFKLRVLKASRAFNRLASETSLPPNLAFLKVEACLRKPVLAAGLFDRYAGVGLAQKADDLFFGESLLHVQSFSLVGIGL